MCVYTCALRGHGERAYFALLCWHPPASFTFQRQFDDRPNPPLNNMYICSYTQQQPMIGAPPQEEEGEEMTWAVRRSWVRDDVSCGTSIPLISTHPESQIVYCVGLKEGR